MMLILLLIAKVMAFEFSGSVSFRTPKIAPNPYDWEVAFRVSGKSYSLLWLKERENGKLYYGRDISLCFQSGKVRWKFEETISTAKDLFSQKGSVYYNFRELGLGITQSWRRWKRPRLLASISFRKLVDRLLFEIEYSDNFTDRRIIDGEIRYKVLFRKPFSVELFTIYRYVTGKTWWQAKVEVKYAPKGIMDKVLDWGTRMAIKLWTS